MVLSFVVAFFNFLLKSKDKIPSHALRKGLYDLFYRKGFHFHLLPFYIKKSRPPLELSGAFCNGSLVYFLRDFCSTKDLIFFVTRI